MEKPTDSNVAHVPGDPKKLVESSKNKSVYPMLILEELTNCSTLTK